MRTFRSSVWKDRRVGDHPVPQWATRARNVFRTLIVLYGVAWLITGVLELSNLIFDTNFFRGDAPTWLKVILFGLLVVWVVCGLVWLAGAVVVGYREPTEKYE
jgi:hypothetical protein